ncbi:YdbT family protein [Algoriphagus machipongonensis]|uniref:Uncharacterized protein n=1 Tax=Algoriphagus machipongonensis TaxID=388413 RepID=A3HYB4_9BACT|nr:hypothetical protein [Algoriphagus machipongonensis]EAZ80250.1 hypothetical protein ALPR1_04990 [Algoriphagus machipongonensis]
MSYQVYNEEQSYRGSWVMYMVLLTEVPTLVLMLVLFFTSEDRREIGIALFFVMVIMVLVFMLLLNISLKTRIDHSGIHYKYSPFIRNWRTIPKEKIKSLQVISFNPLFDYGGWGMKRNKTTKLYNILGDEGLLIDIGEKRKILLGTAEKRKLKSFIQYWKEEENA